MKELIEKLDKKFEEYLYDESKLRGNAESISFPRSKEEILEIFKKLKKNQEKITIQGSKTGICGGAVPLGGHVLNLKKMNKILNLELKDSYYILQAEAGVTLSEIQKYLNKKNLMFPVEPTEEIATLGGIVSTDAKGICSDFYGSVENYIEELNLITPDGEEYKIARGKYLFENNECILSEFKKITLEKGEFCGKKIEDLIDLIIGSEGIFGVITEVKLKVILKPNFIWGICFFVPEENQFQFAEMLKKQDIKKFGIVAVEYLDNNSLLLVEKMRRYTNKIDGIPEFPKSKNVMFYIELHKDVEEEIEETAMFLMEIAGECGCEEENMWALSDEKGIEKFRALRHFLPEAINIILDERRRKIGELNKLSSDISLKNMSLKEGIKFYSEECQRRELDFVVFGHVLSNHLHLNILPKNMEEFLSGKELFKKFIKNSSHTISEIFSEHGIGKIKVEQLEEVLNSQEIKNIKDIKCLFDNRMVINIGNKINIGE